MMNKEKLNKEKNINITGIRVSVLSTKLLYCRGACQASGAEFQRFYRRQKFFKKFGRIRPAAGPGYPLQFLTGFPLLSLAHLPQTSQSVYILYFFHDWSCFCPRKADETGRLI
jgi:hypothetical protein